MSRDLAHDRWPAEAYFGWAFDPLGKSRSVRVDDALAALVRDSKAPRSGQASGIDARVGGFEIQFEMTSEDNRPAMAMDRRHVDGRGP